MGMDYQHNIGQLMVIQKNMLQVHQNVSWIRRQTLIKTMDMEPALDTHVVTKMAKDHVMDVYRRERIRLLKQLQTVKQWERNYVHVSMLKQVQVQLLDVILMELKYGHRLVVLNILTDIATIE